jgi:hypothetical protein
VGLNEPLSSVEEIVINESLIGIAVRCIELSVGSICRLPLIVPGTKRSTCRGLLGDLSYFVVYS